VTTKLSFRYIISTARKMKEAKYSKKVFAFLDILGFEQIINESRKNPRLISKIAEMLSRSEQIARRSLTAKLTVLKVDLNNYVYRSFSDTSVICGPYDSHDDVSFVSTWIMVYQYLMWKEERTFIRGAVVYGDSYSDENIIFGPALIDAYRLERCKTKAVWPRVLIDQSMLDKIAEEERTRDFYEFLRQDDDNLVYLDYLKELFHLVVLGENKRIVGERQQDFGLPAKFFEEHKQAILTQVYNSMREENQDEKKEIIGKYVKLSEYHNSTIERLRQVIKDLMNNSDLISELFDDQIKSVNAKKLGLQYQPKYSAEEHPEQSDMLNILGTVINRLIENMPPSILETLGIVIIGQTDAVELDRMTRALSREAPRALSMLDETLRSTMIDIDSLGLKV
jgi:RNase H-fold protein (predicted Holliday junction resolvase)